MPEKYYTYRITLANPDNVQVKKSDSQHHPLGEPSGKFASENLERIRELHKAAQNGDLRGPDVEELGELLFNTLFDEGLRSDFFSFYEKASQKDVPLRLELEVDERQLPDVVALPWEFMCNPPDANHGKVRMGTAPDMVFSRWRAQGSIPRQIQLKTGERLRIALAVAAPDDDNLGPVKYQEIENALEELSQTGQIEFLGIVNPANRTAIDGILEQKPHIFHFIGHGRLENGGEIALAGNLGYAEWIRAEDFSELFNRHRPGVVLLQACESGAFSASEAFVGVASRVVQQNIPVVVAMQYEVSNITARQFALEFYRRLSQDDPVDKAVQEGRRHISLKSSDKKRDFATPVIFMRVRDGRLFQRQAAQDDGKISLQKILQDLSKRKNEIESIYMPVAKYLKRMGKKGFDEASLELVKSFLYQGFSAKAFIKIWHQTDATPAQPPKEIHYDFLAEQLEAGQIIPFLGSEMLHLFGFSDSVQQNLTRTLAEKAKYPDFNGTLPMISQYYQMKRGLTRDTLIKTVSGAECAALKPDNPLYHLLGNITSPLVLISTYYDNVLEIIFREKRKKFVVMSHYMHSMEEQDFGKVFLMYSDKSEPEKAMTPEAVSRLNLLEQDYSVIYKICGCFNLCNSGETDPLIISEDDFFNFSRHLERLIPDYLTRKFTRWPLLFFGCNLREWQDRLVAKAILEKGISKWSYTVTGDPSLYEKA